MVLNELRTGNTSCSVRKCPIAHGGRLYHHSASALPIFTERSSFSIAYSLLLAFSSATEFVCTSTNIIFRKFILNSSHPLISLLSCWVFDMDSPGVLKEIDCFISNSLRKQLLLILYKNRAAHRAMETEHIKDGRMKCTLDLLELNLLDGKSAEAEQGGGQTNSYLLRSSIMKLPTSFLGYFVNDECHFVPIEQGALVMDTVKEVMKEKSRVPEFDESHIAKALLPKPSPMIVSARLKANENNPFRGPMSARRKPADNDPDVLFLAQQNLAPWCPVRYKRFVPGDAFENRIPLLYPYEDSEFTSQYVSGPRQDEYTSALLSSLTPAPSTSLSHGRVEPTKQPTLEEIVQAIMIKAHVLRFNKLVECTRDRSTDPHSVTNAMVLQSVQKVAVLVRGWWVVKSELLYPPTTYSEHGTIPSTLLIRARDYIMAVFYRGEHLTRKTISSITRLPALEATEILKLLARKMAATQKGHVNHWEFYPPDHDFIRRYPDVVQQQRAAWEARIRQLCAQLKLEYLVSDGVRKKRRCSGRFSSESGSESEIEMPSLVSGVNISGGSGKRTSNSRRRRQLSLCNSSEDGEISDSPRQPLSKRARTQSFSVTSLQSPLSPPPTALTAAQPLVTPDVSFPPPTNGPALKSLTSSAVTPPIAKRRPESTNEQAPRIPTPPVPPPVPPPLPPPVSSAPQQTPVCCKPEPVSPAPSPPPQPMDTSTAVDVKPNITDLQSTVTPAQNGTAVQDEAHVSSAVGDNCPDLLLRFVEDKIRSRPILSLSELARSFQLTLYGSDCQHEYPLVAPGETAPPPGSEAERELLKIQLLRAVSVVGARTLVLPWPDVPTSLPEEPLFVAKVAGSECGAVSEASQKLRDAILDLFETLPGIKMKDVNDRLAELAINDLSKRTIASMLRHFCIYRHGRYFLRHTISD
ncbi:unnamed protein product [Calicophoron daubneyi]|uniref:DNA-directed RNA polymerase III subunit RPC5 n=1 Tax=Calicophoron daubneyi TaxID=300641 RepID=A0AAV2THN1_CALDB